jgi:phage tail-like protein
MQPDDITCPLPKFFFKVTINGKEIAFQEVSGLDQESDTVEYRAGNSSNFIKSKRRGLFKSGQISMKRGTFKGDKVLLDFFAMQKQRDYYPTSRQQFIELEIELCDHKGETLVAWNVERAVPIKFSGTDLKSDANEIAIESLEFVHEGIKVEYTG